MKPVWMEQWAVVLNEDRTYVNLVLDAGTPDALTIAMGTGSSSEDEARMRLAAQAPRLAECAMAFRISLMSQVLYDELLPLKDPTDADARQARRELLQLLNDVLRDAGVET